MGNTYTLSTPLARIISWWAGRQDRNAAAEVEPPHAMPCANAACETITQAGSGVWMPGLRARACSEDCSFIAVGDSLY